MRPPSASSTVAIVYGTSASNSGVSARCTVIHEYTRPSPDAVSGSLPVAPHHGHDGMGGKRTRAHSVQRWSSMVCCRNPRRNGSLSTSATGPTAGAAGGLVIGPGTRRALLGERRQPFARVVGRQAVVRVAFALVAQTRLH